MEVGVSKSAPIVSGSEERRGMNPSRPHVGRAQLRLWRRRPFGSSADTKRATGAKSPQVKQNEDLPSRHVAYPELRFRNFSIAASRSQLLRETGMSL